MAREREQGGIKKSKTINMGGRPAAYQLDAEIESVRKTYLATT